MIVFNIAVNMVVVLTQGVIGLILLYKQLRFKLRVRNSMKKLLTKRFSMKVLPQSTFMTGASVLQDNVPITSRAPEDLNPAVITEIDMQN